VLKRQISPWRKKKWRLFLLFTTTDYESADAMSHPKDDRFTPKLGRAKSKGASPQKFISRVLRAASKAGPYRDRVSRPIAGPVRKPDAATSWPTGGNRLSATSRRVTVKARLVNLKKAPAGSAIAHLKYIERDGVTPDGERGKRTAEQ